MIVKERDFPERLFKIAALGRRLSANHKMKEVIEQQTGNLRAGYLGETSIDYYLQFFPQTSKILHSLRLQDEYGNFQIDTLILTQNFILILETKNIAGIISFDEIGQVIRQRNEVEESFPNPIAQVNLQHIRLRNWIVQHKFPPIPIEKLIVYANSNSIIRNFTGPNQISDLIIRKDLLPLKVEEINEVHTSKVLSTSQLHQLSQTLIKFHQPEKIDVLQMYNIQSADILKGIFCPNCNHLPLRRIYAKWTCMRCKKESRIAHLAGLKDYYFLFGAKITNQKARDFLQVSSPYVVRNLLKKSGFAKEGRYKGRKYILDFPDIRPEEEL